MSGNGPPVIDGVGHHAGRLLAALAEARPEWRWVWLRRKQRWFTQPFGSHGRVTVLQPWHAWTRVGVRAAATVARFLRPDVLHVQEQTHSFHESPAAVVAARAVPRRRVVVTVHEVHPELAGCRWTRELVEQAGQLLTNDSLTAEKCRRHLGRDPNGILWSPTNVLPPCEPVQTQPGLVVTFGFLNSIKGIESLFRILSRVRERAPHLRWRIVGPFNPEGDPYHAELAKKVRGEWVEFTGGRDDLGDPILRRWLAEAAVMALPFVDGASARRTTLQTAWAFGLPVVTTPPAPGDLAVRPGVNCLVAPLAHPELWEQAVYEVLTSRDTAKTLASGSREAGVQYSWSKLVSAHLDLYDSLLAGQLPETSL
jgi:glycosyltransferase involved in cell wall biosynthesis